MAVGAKVRVDRDVLERRLDREFSEVDRVVCVDRDCGVKRRLSLAPCLPE